MAVVSIDIEAMIEYVSALESARRDSAWAAAELQRLCATAETWNADCASFMGAGESVAILDERLADVRRRLGLAQLLAATNPLFGGHVTMDDKFAETLPADFQFQDPDPDLVDMLKQKLLDAGSDQGMTDTDILHAATMIATMVANSPEPYKTLFTNRISDVTFVDVREKANQFCNPLTGSTIYLDIDRMATDKPAPYHTFFHEFGHSLDFESSFLWATTSTYRDTTAEGTKLSLSDLLSADVYNDIRDRLLAGFTSDADQAARVADAITHSSPTYLEGWELNEFGYYTDTARSGSDADMFKKIKEFYENGQSNGSNGQVRVFNSDVTRTASDVYEAFTNSAVQGWYRHGRGYWTASGITGLPQKEFWAGFYADNITNYWELAEAAAPNINPAAPPTPSSLGVTGLQATWDTLPSASQAAANMAEEMVG